MGTIKIFYQIILFLSLCIFTLSCSDDLQEPVPDLNNGNFGDGLAQASSTQPQLTVPEGGDSSDLAPREVDTPLPYQVNFNTAAFMNCPGDAVPDDSVFFTFKFGAYTSGLQLNPDFDLQGLTSTERERKLESSSLINARAQLSLSGTGYPGRITQIQTNKGNRAVVETLTLNHSSVIQNLVQDGVSYRLGHNASVELKLPYPGNSLLNNLLPGLNTKYTVYLAYNGGQDLRPLKKRGGKYYGRYFNFNFNSKKSYLTGMKEYDLQDDQSLGKWACPPELRFAVHRDPAHTQAVYKANREFFDTNNLSAEWECQEDGSVLSNWEKRLFSVLMKNQHFIYGKTIKWERDSQGTNQPTVLNKRCVRPTNSGHHCYNNQNTAKVEFEESNCTLTGDRAKMCPAYLSVCINLAPTGSGS